ncbi:MAG: alpha-E domain-containing protein [Chloroflexi bacterium]|nr:alpha-E domain-containing protein [Chloroflexota bacterium]
MLCRVAENLFWLSRYVERAVAVCRLVDVTWHLELDAGDPTHGDSFWAPLLGTPSEGAPQPVGVPRSPRDVRHFLAFDRENSSSLVSCIGCARTAARGVRESISSEMWEQLNVLYLSLSGSDLAVAAEAQPHEFYKRVMMGAQLFQGLAESNLARDEPWHFLCLGRYLERADTVARVLNMQAHLLTVGEGGRRDEAVRWLAVLRSCGSAEAYARYYSLRVDPARVVEFLLLNPIFPQSVRFCLGEAEGSLREIARYEQSSARNSSDGARTLGLLKARLEYAAVDEVIESGLQSFLEWVQAQIAIVSDQLTLTYLRDEPQPGRLVAVSRAAMIMAAQQQ